MRKITCKQCGKAMTAKTDAALVKAAKAHFAKAHKGLPVSEAMLKSIVQRDATDA